MQLSRIFLSLIVISFSGIQAKPVADWLTHIQSRVVTEVLPNGLSVLCYPVPGQKEVRVGITYNVGSKDELPGEYGFAHMVEHMIFKGTDKMSEGYLDAIAQRFGIGGIGSGYSACTSRDLTQYYFCSDKANWPVFLDILADCMFNVRFDANHFASEVKTVIEEINMRSNEIRHFVSETLFAMMFPEGHPLQHSIGGNKEILLQATSADLRQFYQRNYHPSKALLTIIGDIDCNQALECARKAFSTNMPAPAPSQLKWDDSRPVQKERTLYRPVPEACYAYGWKLPAQGITKEEVDCVRDILTQRLGSILVDQTGLAHTANVDFAYYQQGGGFAIVYTPKTEQAHDEIELIITKVLDHLMKEGPTELELSQFKTEVQTEFLKGFQNCSDIAGNFEWNYFPERSTSKFFGGIARAQALTKDAIKTFVRSFLQPTDRTTLIVLPIPEAERAAWLKKQQEDESREQALLAQKIRETEFDGASGSHELPLPRFEEFALEQPDKVVTLKNGLTIYLKQRDNSPWINGLICFKDAEKYALTLAQEDKDIVRSLTMRMIGYGTLHESGDELRRYLEERSASIRFVDDEASFTCMEQDLEGVAAKMASLLSYPLFNVHAVAGVGKKRRETSERAMNDPSSQAIELLRSHLLSDCSWLKCGKRERALLETIVREDCVNFHRQHINPSRMMLVLVGNFDSKTVEATLEKTFGAWNNDVECRSPVKENPCVPPFINRARGTILHPLFIEQVYLAYGRITDYNHGKDNLCLKLIGQYLDKKLFEIRERTGLFYSNSTGIIGATSFEKGLMLMMFPLGVNNLEAAQKAINEVLLAIIRDGIPEEDIQDAKKRYQMSLIKDFSGNWGLIDAYVEIYSNQRAPNFYENRLAEIQALTKEEIDAVARAYLDPATWTTVQVGRVKDQRGWWSSLLSWF